MLELDLANMRKKFNSDLQIARGELLVELKNVKAKLKAEKEARDKIEEQLRHSSVPPPKVDVVEPVESTDVPPPPPPSSNEVPPPPSDAPPPPAKMGKNNNEI